MNYCLSYCFVFEISAQSNLLLNHPESPSSSFFFLNSPLSRLLNRIFVASLQNKLTPQDSIVSKKLFLIAVFFSSYCIPCPQEEDPVKEWMFVPPQKYFIANKNFVRSVRARLSKRLNIPRCVVVNHDYNINALNLCINTTRSKLTPLTPLR